MNAKEARELIPKTKEQQLQINQLITAIRSTASNGNHTLDWKFSDIKLMNYIKDYFERLDYNVYRIGRTDNELWLSVSW